MSTKEQDSTQTSFATSSKVPPGPGKVKRTRTSDRRDAEDIDKEGLSELKRQRPSSPSPSSSAAESPKEWKVTEQLEDTTRKKRKRRSERTVQRKRVKRGATSDDANSSTAESSLVTDLPRYNLRRGSARSSKSYSIVKPVDKLTSQQQDDKQTMNIDSLSPPTQVAETPSNPLLNPMPSTSSTKSLLTKKSGSVKETEKASEPVGSAGPSSLRLGYSYIDHSVASDSTKTGHSQDSPRRLSRKKKQGQTRLKQRRGESVILLCFLALY